MALVEHDVPVPLQRRRSGGGASKALHGGNVDHAGWLAVLATDGADRLRVDVEELAQPREPLLDERLAVDEDERRAAAGSDQVDGHHGLAGAGRRTQHAEVVGRRCRPTARACSLLSLPVNAASSAAPCERSSVSANLDAEIAQGAR